MSDNLVNEFEHAGCNVKIYGEDYIDEHNNPRYGVDGVLGVMVTAHRSYELGGGKNDENLRESPDFQIECDRCEGSGDEPGRWQIERYVTGRGYMTIASGSEASMLEEYERMSDVICNPAQCVKCKGEQFFEVDTRTYYMKTRGARVVIPLYLYDHSGISISAGASFIGRAQHAEWDSGIVGVVFDTPETLKECGWEDKTDEEIEEGISLEIEEYDKYLRGEVYVIDIDGDEDTPVGGFLGYEYAMEEAKSMAECHRKWLDKQTQAHIDSMPAMGV